MSKVQKFFRHSIRIENTSFVQTIRGGLINCIPILFIGSFALIAKSFPFLPYQNFIANFANGIIADFVDVIYFVTFEMLSLTMTFTISASYRQVNYKYNADIIGAEITSLLSFLVLAGVWNDEFSFDSFGTKGMILAIIAGYVGSMLYSKFEELLSDKKKKILYDGADIRFNAAISAVLPCLYTVLIFLVFILVLQRVFGISDLYELLRSLISGLFLNLGNEFVSGLLFVFICNLLWFFGIHGSNCLGVVSENIYASAMDLNIASIAAGGEPTEILTKSFIDAFVVMGGCGTTISLLIALILFGRRRSNKVLGWQALFPMIFNINELMVIGLPIILNPIMFIPFILTPIVCYIIAYCATNMGLVPITISTIEWTTPALIGGYITTDSVAGLLLQLVNIAVGVMIYAPFVKLLDEAGLRKAEDDYEKLVALLQEKEENREDVILTELQDQRGKMARTLANDFKYDIARGKLPKLFYQPQYNNKNELFGVEALLRWKHELFGYVYPPLVVKIAKEIGYLSELEKAIAIKGLKDTKLLSAKYGKDFKLSVNLTEAALTDAEFIKYLEKIAATTGWDVTICFELTEQTAFNFNDETKALLKKIKAMGISLAIDDFSMGQTSVNYLKEGYFDYLKLDGGIVKGMLTNERCIEIIASIISLSNNLELEVLAEHVDTKEQRKLLEELGCNLYQGYLFSEAVPLEQLPQNKIYE